MNFLPPEIEKYADNHTTPEHPVLAELNRETFAKILYPQMLSGHVQGVFLQMITKLHQPKRILEIGTFTGYTAICFALGMPQDGIVHTIDINEELREMVERYVEKAGMKNKIIIHTGDALKIIPTLDETFDLAFIDADKINYSNYYDLVIDKVRSGGLILADNVLWSGKVLQPKPDPDTKALIEFNEKVKKDNRVEIILLPFRDGMMMMRKK